MTAIAMEPALGTLVRDIVHDHLPGRQTRLVVIAMSRDFNPKTTVMVFVDGSPLPLLALKVGDTMGACRSVDAEAATLRALAEVDPTMLHHTAPRVLELRQAPLGTALVMSARPGVPMLIDYHRWRHNSRPDRVRRDFAQADRWLRQLVRWNVPPAAPLRWGDGIRERFGSDAVAGGAATATQSIEAELEGPGLGALVHGDFWCGNILQTAGVVSGVVDWDSLSLDRHTHPGSPVHGHAGLQAGRWGAGIGYVMRGQGWYPELVAEFVGDGLEATGRAPDLWRLAMLSGLAEIAVRSDHDGFARQHLELLGELVA
jgi:aminoglycoside phosphotransferase